ncbi:MAG: LolA-like putative outer membrane lipoprotein chaperone [Paludibacter sp.]|nr:LolA-like putative outer membrane lipoprotein chaperone [Paludibacter sp.]
MNKYILSIILFTNSIFLISAQNNTDAERLIDNFINSIKTEAIRTGFNLKISEKNGVNSQQVSGTFILKSNQFYLEMEEAQVWFNGKTQWALLKESNEVSITEPTEQELAETNPVSILSALKKVSKIQFGKTKNEKHHIIVMTPKTKNATFSNVEVQLVKASGNLFSIFIQQKNGMSNHLSLFNYQKKVAVSQNTFVFDKTRFKGVTVNDLR